MTPHVTPDTSHFIFTFRDGGGTIDASEVTEMLKGLFSMARVRISLNVNILDKLRVYGVGNSQYKFTNISLEFFRNSILFIYPVTLWL